MLSSVLILLVVMAVQQAEPTLVQKSSGWCSPNIVNVAGKVTVNCIGVDPRALKRLNAELNRKNLQLADKIREADEWTRRYKELEEQLSGGGDQNAISRQAEKYLHAGELEKAEAVLKRAAESGEKEVDQIAANQYQLGLILGLQFRPLDALPYLERANRYRPENVKYGEEYARVLIIQNDFQVAEPVISGNGSLLLDAPSCSTSKSLPHFIVDAKSTQRTCFANDSQLAQRRRQRVTRN